MNPLTFLSLDRHAPPHLTWFSKKVGAKTHLNQRICLMAWHHGNLLYLMCFVAIQEVSGPVSFTYGSTVPWCLVCICVFEWLGLLVLAPRSPGEKYPIVRNSEGFAIGLPRMSKNINLKGSIPSRNCPVHHKVGTHAQQAVLEPLQSTL
jgi:hypothetical protein